MNFLSTLFPKLIDLILPREFLVKKLEKMTSEEFLESVSISKSPEGLFFYQDPLVRKALWEIKFQNNRKILKIVAGAGAEMLLPIIFEMMIFSRDRDIILIPVPLSSIRLKERGYNQVTELLKEILCKLSDKYGLNNLKIREDLLIRIKHSEPQTKVRSRQGRLRNLQDSYLAPHPEEITNQQIILLDDVTTTGATLKSAQDVIVACKPRHLFCIAIAH